MLKIEIEKTPPSDWNDFFVNCGYGIFSQTKEYSEYVQKWVKWDPFYFRVLDECGNILLQNLIFRYHQGISKIPSIAHSMFKKFKKSYRWTYGPISLNDEASKTFFDYFITNKKKFYGTTHPLLLKPTLANMKNWGTSLIDLTNSKELLEKNMDKHSCKKNIKRSIERGVIIKPITKNNFDDYYDLLKNFKKETLDTKLNYDELYDFWNLLRPIGFDGFLAYKDDIPIGGLTFGHFNNYIIEVGVARSQRDYVDKLYSQDLIKWKIIEWGIENKMKWFDLAGFNPKPQDNKEMGIMKYKEKWGGLRKNYWIVENE